MKISVRRIGTETFGVVLDDTQMVLNTVDLTLLVTEATRALRPGSGGGDEGQPAGGLAAEFARRLRQASDVGIQALLRVAAEDDVLVLLKLCERDRALADLLLRNMSERSRKMLLEDLSFKFRDQALAPAAATAALGRLAQMVRHLEEQGVKVF
ncbi:MAG: hypothetical protein H7841_15590 [Magnetospirillum sp. WYHS-4]